MRSVHASAFAFALCASGISASKVDVKTNPYPSPRLGEKAYRGYRRLPEAWVDEVDDRGIDFYNSKRDVCKNGDTGTAADFGECDLSRFPQCQDGKELICYNRTNRRDKFYSDKHPYFYIDYNRVHCYPADWAGWGGCSSCSPGRYCKSEKRCILDETQYNCPDWN